MIELSSNTNEYSVIQILKVMHINTLRREIALKQGLRQDSEAATTNNGTN